MINSFSTYESERGKPYGTVILWKQNDKTVKKKLNSKKTNSRKTKTNSKKIKQNGKAIRKLN